MIFALTASDADFLRALNIAVDEEVQPGLRFGVWRVLEFSHINRRFECWSCVCDCGAERVVGVDQLASDDSLRCHHTLPKPWINHRRIAVLLRGNEKICQSCANQEEALKWLRENRLPGDGLELHSESGGLY